MEATRGNAMTEAETLFNAAYIRNLLEERRLTITNIQKARRIVLETDKEIIEAICLPAVAYDKDSVQTDGQSDVVINILDRLHIERSKQRYDMTKLNAILDGKESEIEWLDGQVFSLPAMLQKTIIARFYDGLTNAETERKLYMSANSAHRHVKNGIAIIAQNYVQTCSPQVI